MKEVRDRVARVADLSRKYISLTEEDVEKLHSCAERILSKKGEIVSNVLGSLLSDPDAVDVVRKTGLTAERAKNLFERWLTAVFQGNYGLTHALQVFRIGLAHVKSGVGERLMIDTMAAFERETLRHVGHAGEAQAVSKALYWNLSIMIYSYELVKSLVIKEATGAGEELLNRLVAIFSERVYRDLLDFLQKTPT